MLALILCCLPSYLAAQSPDLSVTTTPITSQVDCGAQQTWNITVTNTGSRVAEVVVVEDTPGSWITVDIASSTIGLTDLGGGVFGWEINNLAGRGGTALFTLVVRLDPSGFPNQFDCTSALRQNNVIAGWADGTTGDAVDNDPTTSNDYVITEWRTSLPVILQLPDLEITAASPTITCVDDGSFTGSLDITVRNQGDGIAVGSFSAEATDGVGWTGTGQWSAGALAAGSQGTLSIDTSSWNTSCNSCLPYSFNFLVDLNTDICECDEQSNQFGPVLYTAPIPDLIVTDIDFTNLVLNPTTDAVAGMVRATIVNQGCGVATDFEVTLTTDGCFAMSSQQVANLSAGSSTVVQFPVSPPWPSCATGAGACLFSVVADPAGTVCECDGTNNQRDETYQTPPLPDLVVSDIDNSNVVCSSDSATGSVSVTIVNQGTGPSFEGAEVALVKAGCLAQPPSQTVGPLGVGVSSTLTFDIGASWSSCSQCACELTAIVDAAHTMAECGGDNNSTSGVLYPLDVADLSVQSQSIAVQCLDNGQASILGELTLENAGCGHLLASSFDLRLTVFDDIGGGGGQIAEHTETLSDVDIPAYGFQTFPVASGSFDADFCRGSASVLGSIVIQVDVGDSVCECDGTNNESVIGNLLLGGNIPDLSRRGAMLLASLIAIAAIWIVWRRGSVV